MAERTRVPFEIYQVTNTTVGTIGRIDAKAPNDSLRELATLFDDPKGKILEEEDKTKSKD